MTKRPVQPLAARRGRVLVWVDGVALDVGRARTVLSFKGFLPVRQRRRRDVPRATLSSSAAWHTPSPPSKVPS